MCAVCLYTGTHTNTHIYIAYLDEGKGVRGNLTVYFITVSLKKWAEGVRRYSLQESTQ